jgi:hypothetical protein
MRRECEEFQDAEQASKEVHKDAQGCSPGGRPFPAIHQFQLLALRTLFRDVRGSGKLSSATLFP